MKRRAIVIVCDGLGVGEAPDAAAFGDAGTRTLQHIVRDGKPVIPHLTRVGLLHTMYAEAPAGLPAPSGAFGRLAEASAGKDSTTGHWELMGLTVPVAFPLYPHGFPPEVVEPFEKAVGMKVLHNLPASGTEVIQQYGEEHLRTGRPIVYTSGDSVFQIAAHEEVVPIETLYRWCEIARGILVGPHRVGRVIARPFVGRPGAFTRTHRRHDYTVPPDGRTLLDELDGPGQAGLRHRKDRGPLLGARRRPAPSTRSRIATASRRRSRRSGRPTTTSSSRTSTTSTRSSATATTRTVTPARSRSWTRSSPPSSPDCERATS